MTDWLAVLGPPELAALVLVLGMNVYVLTGGADFGGGVWDLFASGPRRDAQRALIAHSIGPIWEANHVWLILVIVVLFTAFPPAFATLGTILHIPLTLMLLGIVLRGSSFAFRSYGAHDRASQERWGRIFASASIVTPLLLGAIVGAIASGAVGEAASALSALQTEDGASPRSMFQTIFLAPWLAPFPLAIGALALAMFAFLAAVYLALAARDEALRGDFRRRGLGAAVAMIAAGVAGLALAPRSDAGFAGPALVFELLAGVAGIAAIRALWTRRWSLARLAAGAQVSLVLWGWVLAQYPFVIPPAQTLRAVAAPRVTLVFLLCGLLGGAFILIPSLAYLYRTFASDQRR